MNEFLQNITLNFCAEVTNVVIAIKLNRDSSSSIGFNKFRLMLDQAQESRGATYDSHLANLILGDRHWQTELLLESLWWSFKELNNDANISKATKR